MINRGTLWPMAVVGVLALTVGANGFMLYQANRGVAAIEPDYYRKAVDWDSTLAQGRRNHALGWRLTASLGPGGTLNATLVDSAGTPIRGADLMVAGFPIAFEDGTFADTLLPAGDGFAGRIQFRHPGLHEFRFVAHRGTDRFTAVLRGEPGGALAARP